MASKLQSVAQSLQSHLPIKGSNGATINTVTAAGNTLIYSVSIDDNVDTSTLTSSDIRGPLATSLCENKSVQIMLGDGASEEYRYAQASTGKTFDVVITKADCS